jgi:hypothetical protein
MLIPPGGGPSNARPLEETTRPPKPPRSRTARSPALLGFGGDSAVELPKSPTREALALLCGSPIAKSVTTR